jgi:hypothetical protein
MSNPVFESELGTKVNTAKILVVGAGGIGCELLKNLVLTGFKDITVVSIIFDILVSYTLLAVQGTTNYIFRPIRLQACSQLIVYFRAVGSFEKIGGKHYISTYTLCISS